MHRSSARLGQFRLRISNRRINDYPVRGSSLVVKRGFINVKDIVARTAANSILEKFVSNELQAKPVDSARWEDIDSQSEYDALTWKSIVVC